MPSRSSSHLPRLSSVLCGFLLLIFSVLLHSSVLVLSQPPAPQGTYPTLPFREVAVYTDIYPDRPQLYTTYAVAVDSQNNTYIANVFNLNVAVLFPNHTLMRSFDYFYPSGLAIDAADNLYVTSQFGSTVDKYAPNGTLLFTYDNALINVPATIAVDRAGLLYIGNYQPGAAYPVLVLNTDNSLRANLTDCTDYCNVALNAARDTLYVSDSSNNTIYVHNTTTLTRTATINTGAISVTFLAVSAAGNIYVVGNNTYVYELNRTGSVIADLSFYFISPAAIAISPYTDTIYVTDFQRGQVDVFYPVNNSLVTIYRGGLMAPTQQVTVDTQGKIFISNGNGVVVLNPDGSERAAYSFDIGIATDVVVGTDGTLYVTSGYFGFDYPYVTIVRSNGTIASFFDLSAMSLSFGTVAVGLGVNFTSGVIYVLNGAGQIGLYRANGTLLSVIALNYTNPTGFFRAPSGVIYVATGMNQSIAVYSSTGILIAVYDLERVRSNASEPWLGCCWSNLRGRLD